jgi:hypothetical protein
MIKEKSRDLYSIQRLMNEMLKESLLSGDSRKSKENGGQGCPHPCINRDIT